MKLESLNPEISGSKFEAFKGSEIHNLFKINGGICNTLLRDGRYFEGDKWITATSGGGTTNHSDDTTPEEGDFGDLYYPLGNGEWGFV